MSRGETLAYVFVMVITRTNQESRSLRPTSGEGSSAKKRLDWTGAENTASLFIYLFIYTTAGNAWGCRCKQLKGEKSNKNIHILG